VLASRRCDPHSGKRTARRGQQRYEQIGNSIGPRLTVKSRDEKINGCSDELKAILIHRLLRTSELFRTKHDSTRITLYFFSFDSAESSDQPCDEFATRTVLANRFFSGKRYFIPVGFRISTR
jgi:hypothetical protein